jgi:hypothetical protein
MLDFDIKIRDDKKEFCFNVFEGDTLFISLSQKLLSSLEASGGHNV